MSIFGSSPSPSKPGSFGGFSFPSGESLGMVWVRDRGTKGHSGWKQLGDARGRVAIPPEKEVMLQIKPETQPDLSPLASFEPGAIHTLDLWDTKITDGDLVHLRGLTGLQGLNLSRTKLTNTGLNYLAGLHGLTILNLYGTQITDDGLMALAGMTQLLTLWINKTAVTDAGFTHVKKLTALKELYIADTAITENGKNDFKRAVPACQVRSGKGSVWSY